MRLIEKLLLTVGLLLGSITTAFADPDCSRIACDVPEPGSLVLVVTGLVGAVAVARFFGKK